MGLEWLLIPTNSLLLGYGNMRLVRDGSQIQMEAIATFLTIFGAHMNISFIIEIKIFVLIRWSYRSPQLCWLLNLEWLSYIEHVIQSILNTCLFGIRSHTTNIFVKSKTTVLNHTVDLLTNLCDGGVTNALWPIFLEKPLCNLQFIERAIYDHEPRCNHRRVSTLYTTLWIFVVWRIWEFESRKVKHLVCTLVLSDLHKNGETSEWQSSGLPRCAIHICSPHNDKIYDLLISRFSSTRASKKNGSIKAPPLPSRKLVGHAPIPHPKLSWEHLLHSSTKTFVWSDHSVFVNWLEHLKLHPKLNWVRLQLHEHVEDVQRFTSVAAAKPRDSVGAMKWVVEGALSTPLAWICGNNYLLRREGLTHIAASLNHDN